MRKLLVGLLGVSATLMFTLPAFAEVSNPKVGLHLKERTKGDQCVSAPAFGCQTGTNEVGGTGFNTQGVSDGTGYAAYIITALPASDLGVQGAAFGISNDPAVQQGGWTVCADQDFTSSGWPASGESATITWVACQQNNPGDGIQAVLGWIYMYAYSPGFATLTKRLNIASPDLNVVNCTAGTTLGEIPMEQPQAGSVRFSADGSAQGCNPCINDCTGVPVIPSTWGGIKSQFETAGE